MTGIQQPDFGIAVFPYLKTSRPIRLGGYMFRSTEDIDALPGEQSVAIREISEMLFLRDDFRIASATYAVVEGFDLDRKSQLLTRLADVQSVVAYGYSAPHEVFDSLFLEPEHATMLALAPSDVVASLVYPAHHVVPADDSAALRLTPDDRGMIRGYAARVNFASPLWVARGSRIYPPLPQMGLNISQDLGADFGEIERGPSGVADLLRLLQRPDHPFRGRAMTALRWYNHANEAAAGRDRAILNLAVAFEALLGLPDSAKTERLADAIALLLGWPERMQEWASQFYAARSRVAHEGAAQDIHFRPEGWSKLGSEDRFGSLMLLGRQIFRACMATLLYGTSIAEQAQLADKLVSNSERYVQLCATLKAGAAIESVARLVARIVHHRFIESSPVDIELMLGAVRLAASAFQAEQATEDSSLVRTLALNVQAEGKADLFARLGYLKDLADALKEAPAVGAGFKVMRMLADEVWMQTFSVYYALRRDRDRNLAGAPEHTARKPLA